MIVPAIAHTLTVSSRNTTPSTSCLLRCSLSAAHTTEQIDQIIEAFAAQLDDQQLAGPAGQDQAAEG